MQSAGVLTECGPCILESCDSLSVVIHELLGHVEKLASLLADGFQLILDTLVLLLQLLDLCLDLSFKGQLVLL
jgi:hypothetical protein